MKLTILIIALFNSSLIFSQVDADSTMLVANNKNKNNNIPLPQFSTLMYRIGTESTENPYMNEYSNSSFTFSIAYAIDKYKTWGIKKFNASMSFLNYAFINYSIGESWNKSIYTKNDKLFLYAGFRYDVGLNFLPFVSYCFSHDVTSLALNMQLSPNVMLKYKTTILKRNFEITQKFSSSLVGLALMPKNGLVVTTPSRCKGFCNQTYIDLQRRKKGKPNKSFFRLGWVYNVNTIECATKYHHSETYFVLGVVKEL